MIYDCKMHCRVKLKLWDPCDKFKKNLFYAFIEQNVFHLPQFSRISHMYQQKFFLSTFHAYFCFQFFSSLSLPSNGICLCCTNILRREKLFFCCHQILLQPLFQFKKHTEKEFLIRHKVDGEEKVFYLARNEKWAKKFLKNIFNPWPSFSALKFD